MVLLEKDIETQVQGWVGHKHINKHTLAYSLLQDFSMLTMTKECMPAMLPPTNSRTRAYTLVIFRAYKSEQNSLEYSDDEMFVCLCVCVC